ncbi:endonuclease/exonuclease/phosphatase family protein [Rhizoctonia solani 123E]|uniref:Endonuclease/exonuclease/phosphatase family protein n=1 Tax=Rhizoctonia solani 123E TaxID=1423351 RepID=A0A074RHQ3_9AGAM|nr:endonuclease/exonuclease/phosphatase family protein [Rhizoctonia solani 123E]
MLRRSIFLLAVCYLCLTVAASLINQAAATGTFNVLSMNVNGFPAFIIPTDTWNNKETYTMYMGQKLAEYNYGVINVQEDFDYHTTLYKYDNHTFRTATTGGALIGSGLNTLSKYDWIDFSRFDWDQYGDLDEYLLEKGFTFMRVRIDEGVYIDMINLDVSRDIRTFNVAAQRSQIHQLINVIKANSAGNAVIVFGDMSLKSTYSSSKHNIHLLTNQTGLTDAWVQAIGRDPLAAGTDTSECPQGVPSNINCEVGDKVFYRGSPVINLKSTGFFYDTSRFLSPENKPLTDHHPVRVEFAYTLTDGLRQSRLCGGPHGTWFNDLSSIPASPKLDYITLRGADRLDGITLGLSSRQNFTHGGPGGDSYSLRMIPGDYVTSVKLCWGKKYRHTRIFYAQANTSWGHSVHAGTKTQNCTTLTAPGGYGVVGTYGRAGVEIDRLGFIYAQQEDHRAPQ